MVPPQLAQECLPPGGRDGPRKVELHPACPSLDVAAPPPAFAQVEVQEWLAVGVEDARLLLDDSVPCSQLGEHVGEVGECLGRTAPHGARHFCCTGRISGVSTFSHRVCMTRSTRSSNTVSDASAMCLASRRTAARVAAASTRTAIPAT